MLLRDKPVVLMTSLNLKTLFIVLPFLDIKKHQVRGICCVKSCYGVLQHIEYFKLHIRKLTIAKYLISN